MKRRQIVVLGTLIAGMLLYGCGAGSSSQGANSSFTQKQVTVYEKDATKQSEITCVFNDAMPNVPYVSLEQYLDLVYGEDSDYTLTGWGSNYTVIGKNKNTGKTGSKLKINTQKETLTFEDFNEFVVGKTDGTMVDYVSTTLVSREGDPKVTYDLSGYGIDIHAQNGQVFLPLSTWSDILDQSLTYSDYIDGAIYFIREDSSGADAADNIAAKENEYFETLTREQDVAAYAYRELCFALDNLYGRPGRALSPEFVEKLSTLGLDKTLEEGGTLNGIDLKQMKTYLSSTNKAEYAQGLIMLDDLLFDGGHSFFSSSFIFRLLNNQDLEVSKDFRRLLDEDSTSKEAANKVLDLWENIFVTANRLTAQRLEGFGEPTRTWENEYEQEIASIYLFDNTAIFQFDEFDDDVIIQDSGVRPFVEALEYAKENKCDNFVLDLSTNGGGSDQTMGYILSMIYEDNAFFYHYNVNTGAWKKGIFNADKNLDGSIDEKDADVKYGFNYAIMISRYSYSCGNYAPTLAKERGIPLIGETSGGGGCLVNMLALPNECNYYRISSSTVMTDSSNKSVDGGATPDYPLLVNPDDAAETTLYNPKEIVSIMNNHYR